MAEFKTENIRNIAFIGHGDAGKTTLTEGMLFTAKESKRFGSIEDGTTVSDYNQDEIERKISIMASVMHCVWNNSKINMLDTPGYMDFTGEVKSSLYAVELAVLVIHAVSGIEVGTEIVWGYCKEFKIPRLFIVNKIDKEHANFDNIVKSLKNRFSSSVIPVQFPVADGPAFESAVDLISMKLLKFSKDKTGAVTPEDIPANLKDKADKMRNDLKEAVAESDDELLESYLENGDISEDEFMNGIKKAIIAQSLFPVFCTSAAKNYGTKNLLDFISGYCPNPGDVEAKSGKHPKSGQEIKLNYDPAGPAALQVFKTISEQHVGELSFFKVFSGSVKPGAELLNVNRDTVERMGQLYTMNGNQRKEVAHVAAGDIGAVVKLKGTHTGDSLCLKNNPVLFDSIEFPNPVIRMAIAPKSKGDDEKISTGLRSLHQEDPSFNINIDAELKQIIISGQGELHLDIIVKRLKQKMGIEVLMQDPKIPYRETIKGTAKAQSKYKKQSGGKGQYGDTWVEVSRLASGQGFEFENKIVGGVIPSKFIPAVEKGIIETMKKGILAGYPVVDVKAKLYDGSFHSVDSSDMAFKISGSMSFRKAFLDAKPVLLEPIYDVEVVVPEEFMGDVMGDLSGRRGKISGMEVEGSFQLIKARVPLAELYRYSTSLRSMTSGRGMHRRKFASYEEAPRDISDKIKKEAEEEKEKSE